jgi:hypothetical protein
VEAAGAVGAAEAGVEAVEEARKAEVVDREDAGT